MAQRRDMALIDDGRESTTPVEPTSGLGGEFRVSHETLHDTSTDSISRGDRSNDDAEDDDAVSDADDDSAIWTKITHSTRL